MLVTIPRGTSMVSCVVQSLDFKCIGVFQVGPYTYKTLGIYDSTIFVLYFLWRSAFFSELTLNDVLILAYDHNLPKKDDQDSSDEYNVQMENWPVSLIADVHNPVAKLLLQQKN